MSDVPVAAPEIVSLNFSNGDYIPSPSERWRRISRSIEVRVT
jgi:hypothetical protein